MRFLPRALPLVASLIALAPGEARATEPRADLELGVGVSLWGIGGGVGLGLSFAEALRWVSRFTATAFVIEGGNGDGELSAYASLSSGLELELFDDSFALFVGAEAALLYLGTSDFVVLARNVVGGIGAGPVFGVHVPLSMLSEGFGLGLDVPSIYTTPLSVEGILEGAVARGPHLVPAPRFFARQRF